MLSGCQPSEGPASSTFCQHWSNVRTLASPSEATVGSRPIPHICAIQDMVDTLVCGPPPVRHGSAQFQLLTHASDTSVKQSYGQQRQVSQAHQHKGLNSNNNKQHQRQTSKSPSGAVNRSHIISSKKSKVQEGNPLLYELLTNNKKESLPFFQQSKRPPQLSADTSVSSTIPRASPSSDKPFLDDDQILQQIEAKLNNFRAILKARQDTSCSGEDSLNSIKPKPCSSPQATTSDTSGSSKLGKALEDNTSNGSRQDSEWSEVKLNGTTSTKAKQSTGTLTSDGSLDMQFVNKRAWYFELPLSKDFCIDEEFTYSKVDYSPTHNPFLLDISTLHYSLTAMKELISSLDNVEMIAAKKNLFDNILQKYWNGKLDNVHLFTSTEYVRIMQEAAAICTKREEQSPVVFKALSGPTLHELTKKNPSVTLHHKPSNQEYKSTWLNVNQSPDIDKDIDLGIVKNTKKKAVHVPNVAAFSKLTMSVPTSSALKISDRHILNAKEKSCEDQQKSAAGSEFLKTHLSQDSNIDKVLDVKSSVSNHSQGLKQEMDWQEFLEKLETQEKEVQVGEGKIEKRLSDCKSEEFSLLKDPQYDDITDDEESNVMAQVSTHDMSSQYEEIRDDELPVLWMSKHLAKAEPTEPLEIKSYVSMTQFPKIDTCTQYEDISDDESPITFHGNVSAQVATTKPSEQILTTNADSNANTKTEQLAATDSLKQQCVKLTCNCPYFIETEDGFEESLCPKCFQDIPLVKHKNQSESYKDDGLACGGPQSKTALDSQNDQSESDDEWLVIPLTASNVRLEQEIIVLDDPESDKEENQDVPSPLQDDQPTSPCFQKIQEFDTLESFMQSKLKQFDKSFKGCLPRPSEATNKIPSEPESAPCFEAEDSCDTEDSCDYPLQTEHNYLTVSSRVNLPSPLSHQSNSEEDSEVLQPSKSTKSGSSPESASDNKDWSEFFPDLSTDDESSSSHNARNHVTVDSTSKARPGQEKPQGEKSLELAKSKIFKKPRFKKRVLYSDSDSDDDDNNGPNYKNRKRSYSSGPGDPSTQQNERSLNTGHSKSSVRPDKPVQISSSVHDKLKNNLSVSGKVASHGQLVHQNQAIRQNIPSTASTSEHNSKKKAKRERPSIDASSRVVQKVSDPGILTTDCAFSKANSPPGIHNHNNNNNNAQNAFKNLSKPNGKPMSRQLSLPNQSISTQSGGRLYRRPPESRGSPLMKTLSLDGELYEASTLPGCKPSQPELQNLSISKPNSVNSYSTASSTAAKKELVKKWEGTHIQTKVRRRRSFEKNANTRTASVKTATKGDQELREPLPGPAFERQRHNSQESQTPLMKRTKDEARRLTKAIHRQAPSKQNRINPEGYKWSEKRKMSRPSNGWGSDKFSGHSQRPHH